MRKPRCIIAPITFAPDSLQAAAVAAELAAELGAELVLAGIAPLAPPEPLMASPGESMTRARQAEEQALVDRLVAERLAELARAWGGRIRTVLTWGPVGAALVTAAREEHADLVVVPIRREGKLAHLFHDHADRYVLHHSDVPVLVVPTDGMTGMYASAAA
jgi:nucleotide-binding universal stress UspA family protein